MVDIDRILASMYISYYKSSYDTNYLIRAFKCIPELWTLQYLIAHTDIEELGTYIYKLETIDNLHKSNNRVNNLFVYTILQKLREFYNIAFYSGRSDTLENAKEEIKEYLVYISTKLSIIQANNIKKPSRKLLVNLYMDIDDLDCAEKYIDEKIDMIDTKIQFYSRRIKGIKYGDNEGFNYYNNKCLIERKNSNLKIGKVKDKTDCFYKVSLVKWYYVNRKNAEAISKAEEVIKHYQNLAKSDKKSQIFMKGIYFPYESLI